MQTPRRQLLQASIFASFTYSFGLPVAAKANSGTAKFQINGRPAQFLGNEKPIASINGEKVLSIFVHGFMLPDSRNRQMLLQIKNFDEKSGSYRGTATYALRDMSPAKPADNEFLFSSKPNSMSITITEFRVVDANDHLRYAVISGKFEGRLEANVFDPAKKSHVLAQALQISNGEFRNLYVSKL